MFPAFSTSDVNSPAITSVTLSLRLANSWSVIYFSWCLLLRTCLPATSDIVPSFSITDIYLQRFDGFLCFSLVTPYVPAFATHLWHVFPRFLLPYSFYLPTLVWASRFVWFVFSCDGQSAVLILNQVLFSKLFRVLYKMLWVLEWATKSRRILVSAEVFQQKLIISKKSNWRVIIKELSVFYVLTILI